MKHALICGLGLGEQRIHWGYNEQDKKLECILAAFMNNEKQMHHKKHLVYMKNND